VDWMANAGNDALFGTIAVHFARSAPSTARTGER
jgi:hypothetical protein